MAIVRLVKVTLYGPVAERDAALDALQQLGCLHLEDLSVGAGDRGELVTQSTNARDALQYLRDSPVQRRALRKREDIDVEAIVDEILGVRERSHALAEERVQLGKWIGDLEPWGDFELPGWAREGSLRFWFYAVPLHALEHLTALTAPWQIVARDHRFAYTVVIAAREPTGLPVAPTELPMQSLAQLRARLEEVETEIEQLEYRRIGLTLYTGVLRASLDEADDLAARASAARRVLERDGVFAVRGWAPVRSTQALRDFAATRGLALELARPGDDEQPPTLLENTPTLAGGEDLMTFYMTPEYRAWDPSVVVLLAFAVFFAMILADAGYALVLAVGLAFLWKRLGASAGGRRARGVMTAVVACSLVYGILAASYFGVAPPPESWLGRLRLLDANDQTLMMWLSIGVGAVHLGGANLVTAWRRRRSASALGALGWALIILGGTCYGLGGAYESLAGLAPIGFGGLVTGAPLVLLFSSERPLSIAPRELLGRFVDGLKGATQITKAFGDVLSYLRLFALGLAALKLAEVFNGLAATISEIGGVGPLLAALVLLVGHGLNLVMGIMSGVVHSLRLNFIEFFSWSLPNEGRRFAAFGRKADGNRSGDV